MRIAIIVTIMNSTDNLIVRGVPVTSTIIEFDDNSLGIIDTGMADNPDLLEQMDEMGFKPSDFSLVMNTHLHPDHCGGNKHFTNARIIVSKKELVYQSALNRHSQQRSGSESSVRPGGSQGEGNEAALFRDLKGLAERYPISEIVGSPDRIEFIEDLDRLPGKMDLIPVPGHSIDDHAVVLHGDAHHAIVAGDALYHRDLWHQPVLTGLHFSEEMFFRNAKALSQFAGIIIPGHDRAFHNTSKDYLEVNAFIPL